MGDEYDTELIDALSVLPHHFPQQDAIVIRADRSLPGVEEVMPRHFSWIAVGFLIIWQLACGDGTLRQPSKSNSAGTPSANISISPGSAVVGSPDLTLTVSGSKNFTFFSAAHKFSLIVWSQGGIDTSLLTTFVSSSQLTAILPAPLLASDVTAKVRVEIWDVQGDAPIATSSSVPFQVTSAPTPTPSISSISPSTVAAGSEDVTITINGSNFGHYGHFVWSTAFWTTNGNLHDTGKWLQTAIISSSQLTAVIPAALLQSPTSVHIVVMNGDVMGMSDGYFGYPRSNSVTFTVTP
jgi:IPT/TIG domain